jgi:hypothetical protein
VARVVQVPLTKTDLPRSPRLANRCFSTVDVGPGTSHAHHAARSDNGLTFAELANSKWSRRARRSCATMSPRRAAHLDR